ncbi:protein kinase family protein [Streptomyces diastatochromogenes]|uniref:hypothetical protein n=1 Tax=Streptomyces diastatochromogenes TaxID=42236 RepID=UPI003675CC48
MTGPHRRLAGQYRLERPLAEGGFGRIWQARDEHLDVDVAVKEVAFPAALDPAERSRRLAYAAREARNAARLRHHPHILPAYSVFTAAARTVSSTRSARQSSWPGRRVASSIRPTGIRPSRTSTTNWDAGHRFELVS